MLKKILLTLFVALIVIQFFHPQKNISAGPFPQHVEAVYPVPENIKQILASSCYDCHSDNTSYPWYNRIQPVAWWLANHVKEGKAELNFSQFGTYSGKKQRHKLEEVTEMVKAGEMPLNSYTWVHGEAKLSADAATQLTGWADGLRAQITKE